MANLLLLAHDGTFGLLILGALIGSRERDWSNLEAHEASWPHLR